MNVTDVKEDAPVVRDRLEEIFKRQHELAKRYQEVEERSGVGRALVAGRRFDLDDIRCQYVLKDFAWRTMEEVGEALDAQVNGGSPDHAHEEIADGLHFLTELCILAGVGPGDIDLAVGEGDMLDRTFRAGMSVGGSLHAFVQKIGMAMNCLKQKPWKQTSFRTDVTRLKFWLILSYRAYCGLAAEFGMTAESLYDLYFKKNKVNNFRIDSKY